MEVKMKKEDNLHAVWFAAGTAALMACMKRAAVVEQWRVWVFLALNLLLLAILFTSSTCSSSTSTSSSSNCQDQETDEKKKKKRRNQCKQLLSEDEDRLKLLWRDEREREVVVEEDEAKTSPVLMMSKEELNERVEAFIAMFRQHLVSDAKKDLTKSPFGQAS
uniref:Uncharacterized protein n=1 Tax=Davidia involucrata TaxID=16924 RepID=A0A5B7BFP7_DAVIN